MRFKRLGGLLAVHRETESQSSALRYSVWTSEQITVLMDGEMVPGRMEDTVLSEFVFLILHQVLSRVLGTIQIASCLRKNKRLHPKDWVDPVTSCQ